MLTMHILPSDFWLRYFPTFVVLFLCQYRLKEASTKGGVYIRVNSLNDHGR